MSNFPNLQLISAVEMLNAGEIEAALQSLIKGGADALLVTGSAALNSNRKQIIEFTKKHRLPTIHYTTEWVNDGGLMTYGVNRYDLTRRAATYVDKILKGARPGDLPVEQPAKFELVINLRTARQMGIAIPQKVLARADRVIR